MSICAITKSPSYNFFIWTYCSCSRSPLYLDHAIQGSTVIALYNVHAIFKWLKVYRDFIGRQVDYKYKARLPACFEHNLIAGYWRMSVFFPCTIWVSNSLSINYRIHMIMIKAMKDREIDVLRVPYLQFIGMICWPC